MNKEKQKEKKIFFLESLQQHHPDWVEVKHRSADCTDYTDSGFFLKIADNQSVFYFLKKKTQTQM